MRCFANPAPALCAPLLAVLLTAPSGGRACGWTAPFIEEMTTFDPAAVLPEVPRGVFYDPNRPGFGYGCRDCATEEMLADWAGRLGPEVAVEDWKAVLFNADLDTLRAISETLAGRRAEPPAKFAHSSVLGAAKRLRPVLFAALDTVRLARRVEPFAGARSPWEPAPPVEKAEVEALLTEGRRALEAEQDPFFRQRRAFLLLRLIFYTRPPGEALDFATRHEADLRSPSRGLRYRGEYYAAGALLRAGRRAEANLLLARIHTAFPALAEETLNDFQPREKADWSGTLALAKSREERIALWRMVGIKYDPVAAAREIQRLDPASEALLVLALRELGKQEAGSADLSALAESVRSAAAAAPTDTRWRYDMVAAHLAALRGRRGEARRRLAAARRTAPKTAPVQRQMNATAALALARRMRAGDPSDEEALMRLLNGIGPEFNRAATVRTRVLSNAAEAYRRAGRTVDAALLFPSSKVTGVAMNGPPARNNAFMARLLRRVQRPRSPFDRFIIRLSGFTAERLKRSMALLHLKQGEISAARRMIREAGLDDAVIGADLFSVRINDYPRDASTAPGGPAWTMGQFADELARLETVASGEGEAAAEAAMHLGNGLYRSFAIYRVWNEHGGTYHLLPGPNPAFRWYRRAYHLTRNRERKAEAAFLAAKCEVNRALAEMGPGRPYAESPTWYRALEALADTAYQRQVLAECGWYRSWAAEQAIREAEMRRAMEQTKRLEREEARAAERLAPYPGVEAPDIDFRRF